jgi:hypothetical protein
MSFTNSPIASPTSAVAPEKYLIAFVIQGDDVFKITADNIVHTTGTATGPAFDAIAKLKAAAALLELTNRHKERPDELRQMARELANEGMKLMARAGSVIQPVAQPPAPAEPVAQAVATAQEAVPVAALVEQEQGAEPDAPAGPVQSQSQSPTHSKIALISG